MVQKMRKTMGILDKAIKLDKIVELDEGFFERVDTKISKDERQTTPRKRSRGSQKQSTVMVMASTVHDFDTNKIYAKPTKFCYVRMIQMDDQKGQTFQRTVEQNIEYDSVVKTDGFKSYNNINDIVWAHKPVTATKSEKDKVLPWVHTMISIAKRTLLGIHHMVSKKFMQDYLDEFCFKVNRRYFGEEIFNIFLASCITVNYKTFIND